MTRILLTLVIIFSFGFAANAQFSKGSTLLGGNISFSDGKTTMPNISDSKTTYGNFHISLGKAIKENAVFGVNINYLHNSNEYPSSSGTTTSTQNGYGIAIYYRQYKDLGKEFYLFGEGGAGYFGTTTTGKDNMGNKLSTATSNGGQIYLSPGIAYKASKKLFIELSIPELFSASYSSYKTKTGSVTTYSNNGFNVSANLNSNPLSSLGIGFRLVL